MRYQRLDLNLLPALRALLAECNVTRAADKMAMSQSAMSGALARLREYFDDPLIVQVGRRMERTPFGESIATKVGDLLLRLDVTLSTRPEFNPATTTRHFTVVATDYAVSVLFLDVLREMRLSAPGVSVEFKQPHPQVYQALEAGEADFMVTPDWVRTPGFSSCFLYEDEYCCLVDKDNASYGDSMTPEAYRTGRHVAYGHHGPPMVEAWLDKQPADRRFDVEMAVATMLPRLLIGTDLIATLPTRLAAQACAALPVRVVALDFKVPRFRDLLMWHQYRDHDPAMVWFREQLLHAARALPALPLL